MFVGRRFLDLRGNSELREEEAFGFCDSKNYERFGEGNRQISRFTLILLRDSESFFRKMLTN